MIAQQEIRPRDIIDRRPFADIHHVDEEQLPIFANQNVGGMVIAVQQAVSVGQLVNLRNGLGRIGEHEQEFSVIHDVID